jgi:signal recognition particle subunit SRP54
MGSIGQLLGMLPGAASALKQADVSDRDLGRVEAIIRSMTPDERRNPKIIDGSRKRRIAGGSGTTPQDVNGLLRQFAETQKLMKAFAGGKSPLPGLDLPGMGRRRKR